MSEQDPKEKQFKKFKKLDESWRNEMMSRPTEEVNAAIRKSAIDNVVLAMAKELDEDLKRLQEELATARQQYTEGTKLNNIRIEFLVEVLRGRGVDVPSVEDFLEGAKKTSKEELEGIVKDAALQLGKTLRRGESLVFNDRAPTDEEPEETD